MCADALARKILVRNHLVRQISAISFRNQSLSEDTEPLWQWPEIGIWGSHRVANEDDDKKWSEHGAATYEPWQSVLDQWDEPARTREGAIEALRAALSEEDGVYGTDAAHCMVKAALGYLEGVRA